MPTIGPAGGTWTTKQSMLADMNDTANHKMNSEEISGLQIRVYDDTAIATYISWRAVNAQSNEELDELAALDE